MPDEWPTHSVAELMKQGVLEKPLDGNHGAIHPKGDDFVSNGIPFVMASDLKDGSVDLVNCKFITKSQADNLRKGFAREHDVLLSHKATMGRTAIVGRLNTPYIMLTPQVTYYRVLDPSRLNNRYLKYYFDTSRFQEILNAWSGGGSTRAYLGIGGQQRLPIIVPPISEQRAIAHILGTLDDKIELNRRMNATLEEMARAIFKSWFVDFEPVRAKVEGRWKRGQSLPGLPAHFYDLFPDSFVDSELGEIPKGWEVKSLDQIATYLNGLALQKYPLGDGPTLPVIKIAQLRKGDSEGADRCDSSVPREYLITDGDVLFSWSGSLEVVLWCGGAGALNQHLFKITSAEFPKWFYLFWTLHHLDEFRLIAADKATTMGHIQRKHLSDAKVLIPSLPLLDAMNEIMSPFIDRTIATKTESRTLAAIRDVLLPKLISGEIHVPAAKFAEVIP